MIVEWFLGLAAQVVDWFSSLLPAGDAPAFIGDVTAFFTSLVNGAAGLGGWVPWAYLGVLLGVILLLWLAFASVLGLRWLWGLTPFSGGT